MNDLERNVLAYVAEKRWRGEIGICKHFGKEHQHLPTVDALFKLVREGCLEWFGAEEPHTHLPLRYRVTPTGRAALLL